MKAVVIARIAHEINRAYCASLGDTSQAAWEEAPEWQQQSALAGVDMHLANPDATPEQSHESWLEQKVADGWVYGPTKDAEKKEHPCCVPYDQLPLEQKSKDYLFRAVVHLLKDIPDADEAVAEAVAKMQLQAPAKVAVSGGVATPGQLGVQYIGRRSSWSDNLYRTGLEFEKDQVRALPASVARKLLRHIDLFQAVELEGSQVDVQADDTAKQLEAGAKAAEKADTRALEFAVIDQVNQMNDKDTLADFAMSRFQIKLAKTQKVETMRAKIIDHIDRFGVA